MTDNTPAPKTSNSNALIDLIPVAIFVGAYQILQRGPHKENAIFIAAGIFMIAAIAGLGYSRVKHGKFSGMLLLTTVIIIITVGLAFFFDDPRFIYMKPTVVNCIFGAGIIGGVLAKKNVIKMMMGEAFDLPLKAWNTLAIRWGIFFFVLAAINEVVWRNFEEDFWVNFKLFGFVPITLAFAMSQVPFMLKHGTPKDP